jgi:hypothetical protein
MLKLNKLKAYEIIKGGNRNPNQLAVDILEDLIEKHRLEYNSNLEIISHFPEGFITSHQYYNEKFNSTFHKNKFALDLLKKYGLIDKKIAYNKPVSGGSSTQITLNLENLKPFLTE